MEWNRKEQDDQEVANSFIKIFDDPQQLSPFPFFFLSHPTLLPFILFQSFRTGHMSLVADYIIAQQKKGVNKVVN